MKIINSKPITVDQEIVSSTEATFYITLKYGLGLHNNVTLQTVVIRTSIAASLLRAEVRALYIQLSSTTMRAYRLTPW